MSEKSRMKKAFVYEKWQRIDYPSIDDPPHYEVSNLGRLRSFQRGANGKILNGSVVMGYKVLCLNFKKGQGSSTKYVHRLVAEYFVPKTRPDETHVLHVDFDSQNNRADNLRWATKEEDTAHRLSFETYKNRAKPKDGKAYKLSAAKVKIIRKILSLKSTREYMIAKQFGVSRAQISRIKNGENWKED